MKKILFLVNHDVVIYNFRKELVERLLKEHYRVIISSPYGERIELLKKMGCKYVPVNLERHGMNPLDELKLLSYYMALIKKTKPDMVLSYTIKPNIYGALAAKKCHVPCVVNITGLGTALAKPGILRDAIILLYKYAFHSVQTVFVQNKKDLIFFQKNRIAADRLKLVPGSGVNLDDFSYREYQKPMQYHDVFLFVGRVMKDKGIKEYVGAAEAIKKKYPNVCFEIVGFLDGESKFLLDKAEKAGIIKYYGEQSDMHLFYERCSAVVLPSYHEGMANVLLEASATGRPVIASDIPGCRESFEEGITGFRFRPRDVDSLYHALEKFILTPVSDKEMMGRSARDRMMKKFDRNIVVQSYMEEISAREYKQGIHKSQRGGNKGNVA